MTDLADITPTEKAKILIEALPYIKAFYGKTVVIKYGGSAMLNDDLKNAVMQDIVLMKLVGMRVVVVHGGGPEINAMLKQLNIQPSFVNGLRVTDDATMDVVEMVLAGKVNKAIVNHIQQNAMQAVGISGKDGRTLQVRKALVDGHDLGLVGEVETVNPQLINSLLDNEFIPVVSPIGTDENGQTYNVNADYAAVAIAGALQAQKLVFLTDVAGVLQDVNDPKSIMSKLTATDATRLIHDGTIAGGMKPKVECCLKAVEQGVNAVHILDGRLEHSLLLEIFTTRGIGTMIEA